MKILKTKTGRHLPRTWEKIDGTQILDPDARQLERELRLSEQLRVELLAKINKVNNDPR
jgi:hypothetical protein